MLRRYLAASAGLVVVGSSLAVLPFADFSPITYTSATAGGQALGSASDLQEVDLVDNSNKAMDTTSALTGGSSFTNTWLRSN